MGTEVLRPQDCLGEQIGVAKALFHRRRSFHGLPKPNNYYRKPVVRPDQKKRFNNPPEPSNSKRSWSSADLRTNSQTHHLVMGRVTMLKRGEPLDEKNKSDDLIVCGTERLGPDPGMVPKQIRIKEMKTFFSPDPAGGGRPDVYAGSAFSLSPSPSSLPLPSFFSKKQVSKTVDDSATRDLRRLLRLG